MFDGRVDIHAIRAPWKMTIDIYIMGWMNEQRWVVEPATTTEVKANDYSQRPPALELRPEEAQLLMDQLWDCGIKPSAGLGSVGQMAATKAHVIDLQVITFKLLEKVCSKD